MVLQRKRSKAPGDDKESGHKIIQALASRF